MAMSLPTTQRPSAPLAIVKLVQAWMENSRLKCFLIGRSQT